MSKIVLTRVDSRLIHGQVVTKWLQQSGANEILVVSDELEQLNGLKVPKNIGNRKKRKRKRCYF